MQQRIKDSKIDYLYKAENVETKETYYFLRPYHVLKKLGFLIANWEPSDFPRVFSIKRKGKQQLWRVELSDPRTSDVPLKLITTNV